MNELDDIEEEAKKYGHLVVVAGCAAFLLVVLIWALVSHWFNQRLQADFWPPDRSFISPNILASLIIFDVVTLAAALFYPPVKKALDESIKLHKKALTEDIKGHVSSELSDVHAKLDHVIKHHPDIPEFVHRDDSGKFKKKP